MSDIEHRLIRIEDKLDNQNAILSGQHVTLKDHIRRTEALEAVVMPMQRLQAQIAGIIKLILFIVALAGGIEGIVALLTYLKH